MHLCGLARVAVMALIAVKLAVGDCSGFHASGLALRVPSNPITVRVVLSKSCFANLMICLLVKVQGQVTSETIKKYWLRGKGHG